MKLRNARNPIRRNKNIGTSKQGYKRGNSFLIAEKYSKRFYESLKDFIIVKREINNNKFTFIVEKTRENSIYPVSIQDLEKILLNLELPVFEKLNLIVFRQPKRKEEILNPVWGRLIYFFDFENNSQPAIIIEAQEFPKKLKWDKNLTLTAKNEFELLKKDGYNFTETKRNYEIQLTSELARNTQLYRTFLHEIGHYVQYFENIEKKLTYLEEQKNIIDKSIENLNLEPNEAIPEYLIQKLTLLDNKYDAEYDYLSKKYLSIPNSEREIYANNFAIKMAKELKEKKVIPFDRILEDNFILENKLKITDFKRLL